MTLIHIIRHLKKRFKIPPERQKNDPEDLMSLSLRHSQHLDVIINLQLSI